MSRSVLPQRSKDGRFFQEVGGACLKPSGHTTRVVCKTKNQKSWVLKELQNPLLSQIEAGMAALYALIKPTLIPKVRAVHKTTIQKPDSEYYATVSKVLPDFMDFENFLGSHFGVVGKEGETAKTLDFLIHHGLAESCALSYFFEEDDLHKGNIGVSDGKVVRIDFDMSGFSISSQSHLRGPRVYSRSTFPITARDLSNFPVLTDAVPYYWLTTYRSLSAKHGYAVSEANVFSTLQHNDVFVGKSYLTFLKIIFMPDTAIKATLAAHISDAATLEAVHNHFIARKGELKSQLFVCPKFQTWWQRASLSEMQSIFQEMRDTNAQLKEKHRNLHIDTDAVAAAFHQFSREMAKEKIEGSLLALAELTKSYRSEMVMNSAASSLVDVYSILVAMRDFLFATYKAFQERLAVSTDDIAGFVRRTSTALIGFKLHSILFPPELQNNLNDFFQNIDNVLHQLQRDQSACVFHSAVSGTADAVQLLDLQGMQDCTFVHVPVLNHHELVRDAVLWLRKADNRSMVLGLFKSACEEYEKSTTTVASQVVYGMYSGITSACSWFVAKPATADVVASAIALPELNTIFLEMSAVESPDQLCQMISRLLSETKPWSAIICEHFVLGLINQFSREFSAKHIVEQMQKNPDFAEYLKSQPNNQVDSAKAIEIARLMIVEMQPQSEDSDEFKDCVMVEHSSFRWKGEEKSEPATAKNLSP